MREKQQLRHPETKIIAIPTPDSLGINSRTTFTESTHPVPLIFTKSFFTNLGPPITIGINTVELSLE